jgi:hypothetical protein
MKADIQKILLNGEDRPDLYSVHRLQDIAPEVKPKIVAEFHGRPINYHVNGGYEACILDLIAEQNWEFEYVNRTNNFTSYFNDKTDPENPTLASFEIVNSQGVTRWINYKMCGVAGTSQGIPEGNTITYSEVFPGIDLRYIVDTWRLKEDIIIKQSVSHYGYKFTLKLDASVSLIQQQDGSIDFVDIVTSERLWGVGKPYATDAEGKQTWGVKYYLGKELYNGVEYDSIEVVLEDTEFIANAVFPVVIDPTTTYNVSAAGDDMVAGGVGSVWYPPFASTANTDTIYAYSHHDSSDGNWYSRFVLCVRFITSSMPDTAVVESASFKGYVDSITNEANRSVECDYYTGAWDGSALYAGSHSGTAFNKTVASFVVAASNTIPLNNAGANINKAGYTAFRAGIDTQPNTETNSVSFYSFEYTTPSYRPVLIVTYSNTPPSAPASITAPTAGVVWNTTHTITWTAATDSDGDSLQYNIDLSIDGGGTYPYQIVALTAAGALAQAYNFSAIPASTNCKIRMRAYDGAEYGAYAYSGVFTIQHNQTPTAPTSILIEGATNPTYVLDTTPEFSAIFNDPDTGDTTTKIEIQVGTTDGGSDKWNSGVLTIASTAKGTRCPDVAYAGSALQSGTLYYVQLRFTDAAGAVSAWVKGQFIMGWLHKIMGVTPSKIGGAQPKRVLGLQ